MIENNLVIDNNRVKDLYNDLIIRKRRSDDTQDNWYVYDSQIDVAKEIIYNFYSKQTRYCLLLAEMQSGKSGTFFSVPYIISRNETLLKHLKIDITNNQINVYLLTGLNEIELIKQLETDITGFTGMDISKNILHNSEMSKFLSKSKETWSEDDLNVINKMSKNSLILIDESHYGSDKNQILGNFLTKILNINAKGDELLEKNNIYMVSISATPMAELLSNLETKKNVRLKTSDGYYGICDMFEQNKIFPSFDLKTDDSVDRFIDTILQINKNGYVLVRCNEKLKANIKKRLSDRSVNIETEDYDQYNKSRILDNMGINDLLQKVINKPKIIFLKGLLRAGKRVDTENVIMVHDTAESKTDTTVQSLLGRCCGYGKNKDIQIYCDYKAAVDYRDWVASDFSKDFTPSKAKNILGGKNNLATTTYIDSIIFDIKNNLPVLDIVAKGRRNRKEKEELLLLFNNETINSIIKGKIPFEIATLQTVSSKTKESNYLKNYANPKQTKKYFGDWHVKEDDLGKIVIAIFYEEDLKELMVQFGQVIRNNVEITVNPKTIY